MTPLARAIAAEVLKLRRTVALRLAIVAPGAVVLLNVVIASQQTGRTVLLGFAQGSLMMWTLLALPPYAALVAALVASLDHQGDNWKHVFVLPLPRQAIFAAKWAGAGALLLLSSVVLGTGVWLSAEVLGAVHPDWRDLMVPASVIGTRLLQSVAAALLLLSIQLWVSLRWKSFVGGPALAIVAVLVMLGGASRAQSRAVVTRFYPWALPVTTIARLTEPSVDRLRVAMGGGICGLVAAVAGCWALSRRDF